MKINSFFKTLNRKINMYDKMSTNPFIDSNRFIIVWVEESDGCNNMYSNFSDRNTEQAKEGD